ncbi:hypothetical protein N7468_000673 [Penicillium chermesinum]|uniref:Uncharacterized protein n=1 Tax=Penicillium chermesinum TaxID=63820 RepID=A0A9W9PKR1_9EURO|nr:uncharacterized protein N7468_000673 [Penicillium chermesinum]KAJ5249222.1 hypothetical protein N7468_000673 [Penicillium chermesinum]
MPSIRLDQDTKLRTHLGSIAKVLQQKTLDLPAGRKRRTMQSYGTVLTGRERTGVFPVLPPFPVEEMIRRPIALASSRPDQSAPSRAARAGSGDPTDACPSPLTLALSQEMSHSRSSPIRTFLIAILLDPD